MMREIWKICLHNDNYEVSTLGGVRRANNPRSGTLKRGDLLKPVMTGCGYVTVGLCKNGTVRRYSVHRLVLESFIGMCPVGMECNHKDTTKTNNRLDNLEWITKSENVRHAYKNGLRLMGENHHRAKLTEKNVTKIRKLYQRGGYTHKKLGEMFGVGRPTIGRIISNESWKHLGGAQNDR